MLAAGAAKSKAKKSTPESTDVTFYKLLYNTINIPLYRPTLLRIVMSVTERDTEVQAIGL